jgi:hypothetical protein
MTPHDESKRATAAGAAAVAVTTEGNMSHTKPLLSAVANSFYGSVTASDEGSASDEDVRGGDCGCANHLHCMEEGVDDSDNDGDGDYDCLNFSGHRSIHQFSMRVKDLVNHHTGMFLYDVIYGCVL